MTKRVDVVELDRLILAALDNGVTTLPAVAVASGSDGPATVVEPGASGAAGSSSGKSGTPAASTHAKRATARTVTLQNNAAR